MGEALTLISGEKELAASNSPEPLTTTSTVITGLSVKAKNANAAAVRVGPSTLSATAYPLEPGEAINFDLIDAARVYLYGKEKDGVNYMGLAP